MPKPTDAIWTPNGIVDVTGKPSSRDKVELHPASAEFLRLFADFAAYYKVGIHCGLCGADFTGKNADTDRVFAVACGCRELIGNNPGYREPSANEAFYESVIDYQRKPS